MSLLWEIYNGWGVDFGGAVLTNNSYNPTVANFVCKYDQWGNFVWVRQFATNQYVGLRVATDAAGNVYVAGAFSGTAVFGTNALVSLATEEMFVAKYDAQGEAIWARRIGASDPNDAYGLGFTVDSVGNAFILGAYSGTADFGQTNVTGSPAFLAKYDDAGTLVWANPVLGGVAIQAGSSGALYTAGPTNLLTGSSAVAKYDPSGNLLWGRPFAYSQAIALDSAENIYVTGMGNGTYGDLIVTNVGGSFDFFVAKCDSNGNLLWSRQMGSTKQETGIGISTDALGNTYIGCTSASALREPLIQFGNTALTNVVSLLVKYDATGNPLWAKGFGTNRAQPAAVRVLNSDSVFVAGTFYGSAQFGSFSLLSDNQGSVDDLYLARLAGVETPALPQITAQPRDQTVRIGSVAAFNVISPSGIPLTYQWYFNIANMLSGATNASLVITNAQPALAGNYFVTVANSYGTATSSVAALNVYLTEAATLNSPSLAASNQLQFQIGGVPGFRYAVEASTNLNVWVRLATNTAPAIFMDQSTGVFQQRFYRAVWLP